jgi:hypothetical protein
MKRLSYRIFSIFFLWLLMPVHGWSAEGGVDVLSVGQATVVGSNWVRAKDEALNQALRRGVQTYLIRQFGPAAMKESFVRIMGELLPQILGDVENYHILAESRIGDEFHVLVRVGINEGRVREKIVRAGLGPRDGPPLKVLFMVADQGEHQTSYWWADPGLHSTMGPVDLVLHNVFQERGFRPINRTRGVAETELSSGSSAPELTEKEAAEWGQAFSADLVIHGWVARQGENASSLTLKVLRVAEPAQICETFETAERASDKAGPAGGRIETLVSRSVGNLIPCISRSMATREQGTGRVEIVLEGLKRFEQLTEFKRFLASDVEGVKSVVECRMKYQSVSLSVDFSGDRKALLRQMLGREIASLSFDLQQSEENKIVLKVR